MTTGPKKHLHVLAKHPDGRLAGRLDHLTPTEVEATLAGTPYREDSELLAVVNGRLDRGYCLGSRSWVAVMNCTGTDDQACTDSATSVVVGGDIRLSRARSDQQR